MTMKNFFIAWLLTGIFLGILLLAGTAQNEGCPPWKEPVTVGGGGRSPRTAATPSVATIGYGAAPESNRPSRGLHDRTSFEGSTRTGMKPRNGVVGEIRASTLYSRGNDSA